LFRLFFRIGLLLFVFGQLVFVSGVWGVPVVPVDYNLYPHLDRTEYLDGVNLAVEAYSLWGWDFFAVANENSGLHIF